MKVVAVVTLFVFGLLLMAFLFAQWVKRNSLFFPDAYPHGYWDIARTHAPVEAFFTTSDGVRLHSWYFTPAVRKAPLLIWFHGNGGNLTHRAAMAIELAARGVPVFLFDYRGYGRSGGRPTEAKLFIDVLAAYDYAAREYAKGEGIALYGESLGGPYAAYVARERQSCAVVIENSFSSLTDLGNALYAPVPVGYLVAGSLRTSDWLRAAKVPVLVMHGKRDSVIPYHLGKRLFDDLAPPKEMFSSEESDHSTIPAVEGDRFYEVVVAHLTKYCSVKR